MSYAVDDFFRNGGSQAIICRVERFDGLPGDQSARTGMYLLEDVPLFNLLCIPWDRRGVDVPVTVLQAAIQYCSVWMQHAEQGAFQKIQPSDLGISGDRARNAAVYFPGIQGSAVCGAIAGVYAANDAARGVWHSPAGVEAGLAGVESLEFNVNDEQNAILNAAGINCLRTFPVYGPVVWGARTLAGSDASSDDYKYVSVRRLVLYIEESVGEGTKFAAFEPNAEPLWAQVRERIGCFLAGLQSQGAFYEYLAQCDRTTTRQDDIDRGVCNIVVMIAPEKPGEFIVLTMSQAAGQPSFDTSG